MATVSGAFVLSGGDAAAHEAMVEALASNESGDTVRMALAASISAASGVAAETVAVTEVAEAVEGSLDFDFGEAAASVASAYEDPDLRADIERTLEVALASGLPNVNASAVTILGISPDARRVSGSSRTLLAAARKAAFRARRLASLAIDYAIEVPLGTGAEIADEVTAIETSSVSTSVADGFREVAEAHPAVAELADVQPVLAPPEAPTTSLIVEYEVAASAGESSGVANQLSTIDQSSFTDTLAANVQAADPSLAGVSFSPVTLEGVVVSEPTSSALSSTAAPGGPTDAPTPASTLGEWLGGTGDADELASSLQVASSLLMFSASSMVWLSCF
jgi:hypothetical protein